MRKNTLIVFMAVVSLSLSMLVGCGNQQKANNPNTDQPTTTEITTTTEPTSTSTEAPATTKPPHEHSYSESVTKKATCTESGEKTFSCACGDTYTEQIDATGHSYGNYVYNNDAAVGKDGTETATCSTCNKTKTRTKEGTKLTPSYDGYDEFGNGFVWCHDGAFAGKSYANADPYKKFYVDNPYPVNQAVWVSDKEVYYYGIYGQPQLSASLGREVAAKNGIPWDDRVKSTGEYKGMYNGKMVVYVRIYMN